jgi:hypothetical protein
MGMVIQRAVLSYSNNNNVYNKISSQQVFLHMELANNTGALTQSVLIQNLVNANYAYNIIEHQTSSNMLAGLRKSCKDGVYNDHQTHNQ